MKYFSIAAVLLTLAILYGCGSSKSALYLSYDKDKGKESSIGDFIRLKNGDVIKGDMKKAKLGLGLLNSKGSVTMADGTEYAAKDIEEFQIDSMFNKRIPGSEKFFYGRKKSGKINLYYRHYSSRGTDAGGHYYSSSYDLYWLQKGKEAPIEKFSVKLLESMVADDKAASRLMTEYEGESAKERKDSELDKIIDVYNGKA